MNQIGLLWRQEPKHGDNISYHGMMHKKLTGIVTCLQYTISLRHLK